MDRLMEYTEGETSQVLLAGLGLRLRFWHELGRIDSGLYVPH